MASLLLIASCVTVPQSFAKESAKGASLLKARSLAIAAKVEKAESPEKSEKGKADKEQVGKNQALKNQALKNQEGIAITVYNQNFGLVKEIRSVDLKDGINYWRIDDVAAGIDPTSVSFSSLTAPNSVVVREQNYQYDLMDSNTILSKMVGKQVKFTQYLSAGGVKEVTGTLLSSPLVSVSDSNGNVSQRGQSVVVKTNDGVVVGPAGQLEIAALPEGLVSKPSLLWKLESDRAGTHKAEITYQTQGLNWKCDYVAVDNQDDSACDITSWVTLDNKSGATYKDAVLKLMAGDVHKVQNAPAPMRGYAMMKSSLAAAEPQFSEQSFAEYHLYSLAGRTDLRDNETKQLTLFNASAVPVKKLYVFEGANSGYYNPYAQRSSNKVNVKLEIANTKANNLGMPMPKGKVRVYKKDQDGALQFVGEDLIDHTPRDEKVRVYLGDAFDIVGERTQMTQQQVSSHLTRASYSISLRNHKDSAVTVTCVEHAYGDWKITNSSQKYTKKDSHTFEFEVAVPANGESKVTYEIETKY